MCLNHLKDVALLVIPPAWMALGFHIFPNTVSTRVINHLGERSSSAPSDTYVPSNMILSQRLPRSRPSLRLARTRADVRPNWEITGRFIIIFIKRIVYGICHERRDIKISLRSSGDHVRINQEPHHYFLTLPHILASTTSYTSFFSAVSNNTTISRSLLFKYIPRHSKLIIGWY